MMNDPSLPEDQAQESVVRTPVRTPVRVTVSEDNLPRPRSVSKALTSQQAMTAELIANGLTPRQICHSLGVDIRELETWIMNPEFKTRVEILIQDKIIKSEKAQMKSDDMLMKAADVLGLVRGTYLKGVNAVTSKALHMYNDPEYLKYPVGEGDFNLLDRLAAVFDRVDSYLHATKNRMHELARVRAEAEDLAQNQTFSATNGVKVTKIMERVREISITEGITMKEATNALRDRGELMIADPSTKQLVDDTQEPTITIEPNPQPPSR